jgi:hypothetical protein
MAVVGTGHDGCVGDDNDRRAVGIQRGPGGDLSGDIQMFGVRDLQQSFPDVCVMSEIAKTGFF